MPVTALVGFLIGVVLSYLSALQLKQFGADIFIVNIIGLGIVRELGPVLVAILVAGTLRVGDDGAAWRDARHRGDRRAGDHGRAARFAPGVPQGGGADHRLAPAGCGARRSR
jgi:hypothetical protein